MPSARRCPRRSGRRVPRVGAAGRAWGRKLCAPGRQLPPTDRSSRERVKRSIQCAVPPRNTSTCSRRRDETPQALSTLRAIHRTISSAAAAVAVSNAALAIVRWRAARMATNATAASGQAQPASRTDASASPRVRAVLITVADGCEPRRARGIGETADTVRSAACAERRDAASTRPRDRLQTFRTAPRDCA